MRDSRRFCYDQSWLREGNMAAFSLVEPEPNAAAKAKIMKVTNELVADLHNVQGVIDSVGREIHVLRYQRFCFLTIYI